MTGHDAILRRLPDEPRWVDLRGLLRSGDCDLFGGDGPDDPVLVRSRGWPFAALAGGPTPDLLDAALTDLDTLRPANGEDWHLLVQPQDADRTAELLPSWRRRGVTLHTRPEGEASSPAGADVRLLPHGHDAAGLDLAHLPHDLQEEYKLAIVRSAPMAAGLADGRAVAFCYTAVGTEAHWDVAVDTLDGYRRRGLAAACFEALATHEAERGRRPVWGALDENVASMRLAAKLGFEPCAHLSSFVAPSADVSET